MKTLNQLFFIIVLSFCFQINVQANPSGAAVVSGDVQLYRPDSSTLNITNSPNAIINWDSFSINAGEITRFIQQNASSAVLNRVTGQSPSAIMGSLLSNGRVFVINPNGIVFGANSVVDTAGLIASTLNISDQDFLQGRYNFKGDSGSIDNQGYIRTAKSGEVVFISPDIKNSGIIETEQGQILLAVGRDITLNSLDNEGVSLKVTAPGDQVLNLGELIADKGSVGLFADIVSQQGKVQTNALVKGEDGSIQLIAKTQVNTGENSINRADNGEILIQSRDKTQVSGQISTLGDEQGGSIKVLGDSIDVINADINASGQSGGGEILIGGDYKGQGELQTAQQTIVDNGSSLTADAFSNGDGGKVIVWSDGVTYSFGDISARAGELSGNGGFVETSGKQYLQLGDFVPDLKAPNGDGGTWLLDPADVNITNAATTDTTITAGTYDPNSGINITNVDADDIDAALTAGTDVIINTANDGVGNGDITITDSIFSTPGASTSGTLTLNAEGDIYVNNHVYNHNDINLNALNGSIIIGLDEITGLTGNLFVDVNGGDITLNTNDDITLNANSGFYSSIGVTEGSVNINSSSGDLTLIADASEGASIRADGSIAEINIDLESGSLMMEDNGDYTWISTNSADAGTGNIDIKANDIEIIGNSYIAPKTGASVTIAPSSTSAVDTIIGVAGTPFLDIDEIAKIYTDNLNIGRLTQSGDTLAVDVDLSSSDLYGGTDQLELSSDSIIINNPIDFSSGGETLVLNAIDKVVINNDIDNITTSTLNTTLAAGTDIEVNSTNITIDTAILSDPGAGLSGNLTLNADNSININTSISNDNEINLNTTTGTITFSMTGTLLAEGGDINIDVDSGDLTLESDGATGSYIQTETTGNISINLDDGSLIMQDNGIASSISTTLSDPGDISINAIDIQIIGNSSIDATGANPGTVTISPSSTAAVDTVIGADDLTPFVDIQEFEQFSADKIIFGRSSYAADSITLLADMDSNNINASSLELQSGSIIINNPIDFSTENENLSLMAIDSIEINNAIDTGTGLLSITSDIADFTPGVGNTVEVNDTYTVNTTNINSGGTTSFTTIPYVNTKNINVYTGGQVVFHDFSQTSGTVSITPGAKVTMLGTVPVVSGGSINNSGIYTGDLIVNDATISTYGTTPGTFTIDGNLTLGEDSTTIIKVLGTTQGVDYDYINVSENVVLNGTMDINADSYNTSSIFGDKFTFINSQTPDGLTGSFSSVETTPSDYDFSGTVDSLTGEYVSISSTPETREFIRTLPTRLSTISQDISNNIISDEEDVINTIPIFNAFNNSLISENDDEEVGLIDCLAM